MFEENIKEIIRKYEYGLDKVYDIDTATTAILKLFRDEVEKAMPEKMEISEIELQMAKIMNREHLVAKVQQAYNHALKKYKQSLLKAIGGGK